MGRVSLFAAVMAIAFSEPGLAQLQPADRIRILTPDGGTVTGDVLEVASDSLHVDVAGRSAWVRQADIAYLERRTARHRRFARNFVVTAASTAGVAGAIAAITWKKCVSNEFLGCLLVPESRSEAFVFGGAVGTMIGVPLGLLVGYAVRHDQWEPVPLPGRLGLTVSPAWRYGPGVSASLSF